MTEGEQGGTGPRMPASLAGLAELARAQRVPTVRVDGAAIVRAVSQRRAARMRWIVGGAMLAAAAAWLLFARIVPSWSSAMAPAVAESASHVAQDARGGGEVLPRGDAAAQAGVIEDREPLAQPEPATTSGPDLAEPADVAAATASGGEVQAPAAPSASSLARDAERAMAQRRRRDAIALLDTLVRRYPNHASAKTALLDLGRLLRETGRKDEARCAYQLIGARWPADPVRVEVDRMIVALGPGPRCRGLRPLRR